MRKLRIREVKLAARRHTKIWTQVHLTCQSAQKQPNLPNSKSKRPGSFIISNQVSSSQGDSAKARTGHVESKGGPVWQLPHLGRITLERSLVSHMPRLRGLIFTWSSGLDSRSTLSGMWRAEDKWRGVLMGTRRIQDGPSWRRQEPRALISGKGCQVTLSLLPTPPALHRQTLFYCTPPYCALLTICSLKTWRFMATLYRANLLALFFQQYYFLI